MILTGTYTQAGQALATRFLAGGTLTLTRIAAGSGKTSLSAPHMAREEQDLGLCSPTLEGRTALLRCTLNTTEAHAPYSLTELGVYASDGENEVLYLLYSLDQPFPVDPAARVVLRFNLEQTLADGASVTIDAPLDGLVSQDDLDGKADLVSGQVPYAQTPHLTANVTLYVDAAAGSDANPGTQQAPFQTIQAAVDSLPKDLGGNYVFIHVSPGVYPEKVTIEGFTNGNYGRGIQLLGAESLGTTHKINALVISCTTCPVTIRGFYIENESSGGSGVIVSSAFGIIYNTLIKNAAAAYYGMIVGGWGGSAATVKYCQIEGFTHGVSVGSSSVGAVQNSTIKSCSVALYAGNPNMESSGIILATGVAFDGNTVNTAAYGGSQIFQ